MLPDSDSILPDRILNWAVNSVDPQAAVVSVKRLYGGTSSTIHSISLKVGQVEEHFVLRQFDNAQWLHDEPDAAHHEAESLRWASRVGVQTPRIIAFDETGSQCGIPLLLMTRLEGSVVLNPQKADSWIHSMAETLIQIHSVEAEEFRWEYYTYIDLASLKTPAWSSFPQMWNTTFRLVNGPRPPFKPCFIHRDYHPVNLLWLQDHVSGVVDWANACRGPAAVDVGHCRWNLAQLYDVPTADAFLSAYRRLAGPAFTYDPYWDLLSVIDTLFGPPKVYPGWTAFGVTGLTNELMVERLDTYMMSLLRRVSSS
ncbi:MAG: hypothetical protein K0S39_571 [Paenibacillus sp.]|nr:hypothetical protein [Paenibacillus sp.]